MATATREIWAHRGDSLHELENTIASVRAAADRGATALEVDVTLTADGVAVVFHDEDLARLAGRPERIVDLKWDELSRVVLRGGATIPRLSEVLAAWPEDRPINLDLKSGLRTPEQLVDAAVTPVEARAGVVVGSWDVAVLAYMRARCPATMERVMVVDYGSPPWVHVDGPAEFDVAAVHLHHRMCTPATIERIRGDGRRVGAWTINDPALAARLFERGVERIFSDDPIGIANALA